MKYLKTKKDSLEEAISKAMNEKPDSSSELKEARYEIEFSPGEFGQDDADDFADMIQNDLKNDYKIRAKVLNTGRKEMGLTFDTNVPKAKMLKVLEDEMGYVVEGYDVNAKELEEAGGKYLKYSDLLLQKGRLIQQGKPTAMIDREISKEMKKLGIKEATGDKEKYTKFFNAALKKFGVKSPADFKDDAKKKEFFNYIDKNFKGDHEESNNLEEVNAKYIMDVDPKDLDFGIFKKKHRLKVKTLTKNVNPGYDEVEVSGDKKAIEKLIKLRGEDDFVKFNNRSKTFENTIKEYIKHDGMRRRVKEGDGRRKENKLNEKDLDKNVDETLDRIREANVEKGKNMRSILADIWKVNEGKSPFDNKKEEQEDKPLKKTLTGKKTTKVEIEPEIK